MRIARFNATVLSLALSMSAAGVASAQVSNGTFTPLQNGTAAWGTGTNYASSSPNFGPNATMNWSGGQYAYDPDTLAQFGWTFNGGAGVQQNDSAWGFTNAPNNLGQTAFLQDYNGTYCYNGGCVPVGTVSSPSSISQSVTGLTEGTQYDLSFYLEVRSYNVGGYAPVVVVGSGSTTPQIAPNSSTVWQLYNVIFTASGSPETIGFYSPFPSELSYGSDLDTGLADVSLSTTLAAPGPNTYYVPEGGADWMYLTLVMAICLGTVFFSARTRLHSRA